MILKTKQTLNIKDHLNEEIKQDELNKFNKYMNTLTGDQ